MADYSRLLKPREYAQHASLPFQGKGWGMGYLEACRDDQQT